MLRNICLSLQYDGTAYYGFQIQNTDGKITVLKGRRLKTVQGQLEKAIRKVFRKRIRVTHCGRTDKGVHAKDQRVNFKVATKIPNKNIQQALNSCLPHDIYVRKVTSAPLDFHARFSAKSKVYRYAILNRREPDIFLRDFVWHLPCKLSLASINRASKHLIGTKDFSAFTQQALRYKSCVRRIHKIRATRKRDFIYIDIEANGFLRGMVRNIVSLLVEVGRHRRKERDVIDILKVKNRGLLGRQAPAQGLFLLRVNY